MRIRRTDFAMVPTWVVLHPEMRGQGTRIAVYVAIRVLAFEMPDYDWNSDREIAQQCSIVVGVGAESCRKHMRVMREHGIIDGDHGELVLPHDPPSGGEPGGEPGTQLGTVVPKGGDDGTHTPISKRDTEKTPPNGGVAGETNAAAVQAREAATAYWDWVKEQTGKPPVGIKFMALVKLIEPFLRAGYAERDVKWAVRHCYEQGRPFTLAVLEQYLDGRAETRRPQRGVAGQMDALADAIAAERRRHDVSGSG